MLYAAGDGDAWRRLYGLWTRVQDPLLGALFTPFPPVRHGMRLLARLGAGGALRFARMGLLPVRRLGEEEFAGAGGPALLGGNALHTDLGPDAAGSGIFGWLLCMLGQSAGFPAPAGGARPARRRVDTPAAREGWRGALRQQGHRGGGARRSGGRGASR